MFWKPKKVKTPIYSYGGDKRILGSFSVKPLPNMAGTVYFQGEDFPIESISIKNLSFSCSSLVVRQRIQFELTLEGCLDRTKLEGKVVSLGGQGVVFVQFVELPEKVSLDIHHYVLEVQKRNIKAQRERYPIDDKATTEIKVQPKKRGDLNDELS